jgi:hypothetical protein
MPRYLALPGSPFSDADAAIIGPELERLALSGASSPDEIVAYAEGCDTPLRTYLHMDKPLEEVAASWYRQRARAMAGAILVKIKTKKGYRTVRAFHSIVVTVEVPEVSTKRRYVTIQQVRSSEAMASQVLADALEALERWRSRYEVYREVFTESHPPLGEIFRALEELVAP